MENDNCLAAYYTMEGLNIKFNGKPNKISGESEDDIKSFFHQIKTHIFTDINKYVLLIDRTESIEGRFYLIYYNDEKQTSQIKELTTSFWSDIGYYQEKNENVVSNIILVSRIDDEIHVKQTIELVKSQPAVITDIIDLNEDGVV